MDTKALEMYYPRPSWRAAYDDVKVFLKGKGFEHEQGSGYHSVFPMTQADAVSALTEMLDMFPWLHKCVKICTIADVPTMYDFSNLFDKDADIPERDPRDKPSVIARIRAPKQPSSNNAHSLQSKSKKKNKAER